MTLPHHGLVIGKFYPPHLGHHRLIRAAAPQVEALTVLVMASSGESVPLDARVAWLRVEHAGEDNVRVVGVRSDAPVDLYDENVWRAQLATIATGARLANRDPIDVLFSCEGYGDELARRLGAEHRRTVRVDGRSATAVRDDPVGRWKDLAPATKAGLAVRIVVVGAESTGTTTLSNQLCDHYRALGGVWEATRLVPEYGRDYTTKKWEAACEAARRAAEKAPEIDELVWVASDFDEIGRVQTELEAEAAAEGSPVLVCDTDAFATATWERRYLGDHARPAPAYSLPPALPRRDVYVVTDHDGVPWLDDGMREDDLAIRRAMTDWFVDALAAAGHSWVLLTGSEEERLSVALRAIEPVVERRLRFSDPRFGPGFGPTVGDGRPAESEPT